MFRARFEIVCILALRRGALQGVDECRCLAPRQAGVGLLQRCFGSECGECRKAELRSNPIDCGVSRQALVNEQNQLAKLRVAGGRLVNRAGSHQSNVTLDLRQSCTSRRNLLQIRPACGWGRKARWLVCRGLSATRRLLALPG